MIWDREDSFPRIASMAELNRGVVMSWSYDGNGDRRVVVLWREGGLVTARVAYLPPEDLFGDWPPLDAAAHDRRTDEARWDECQRELDRKLAEVQGA